MSSLRRLAKPTVFVACLVPLALLAWRGVAGGLGANPIETITHATGDWTLRFLLITLAITPLRRVSGWNRVIGFRRMLGLFAFFYGTLHLLTYLWLDKFFAWADILHDIPKRPFITIGFSAFVLLVPLALTSTGRAIRRLGGRRWRALHRLIYVAAPFGVIHYWWLVKADHTLPVTYACILGLLFVIRGWFAAEKALQRSALTSARGGPPRVSNPVPRGRSTIR
jgi:sulfoxide reductase heme-binding subunit YedZ